MDTDLDRLFRYISLGAAAVATVFFIILGIAQREFLMGILWAAVASFVLWIIVLIAKRVFLLIQTKLNSTKFGTGVVENEEE